MNSAFFPGKSNEVFKEGFDVDKNSIVQSKNPPERNIINRGESVHTEWYVLYSLLKGELTFCEGFKKSLLGTDKHSSLQYLPAHFTLYHFYQAVPPIAALLLSDFQGSPVRTASDPTASHTKLPPRAKLCVTRFCSKQELSGRQGRARGPCPLLGTAGLPRGSLGISTTCRLPTLRRLQKQKRADGRG